MKFFRHFRLFDFFDGVGVGEGEGEGETGSGTPSSGSSSSEGGEGLGEEVGMAIMEGGVVTFVGVGF